MSFLGPNTNFLSLDLYICFLKILFSLLCTTSSLHHNSLDWVGSQIPPCGHLTCLEASCANCNFPKVVGQLPSPMCLSWDPAALLQKVGADFLHP